MKPKTFRVPGVVQTLIDALADCRNVVDKKELTDGIDDMNERTVLSKLIEKGDRLEEKLHDLQTQLHAIRDLIADNMGNHTARLEAIEDLLHM